jgi:chromosomal replication initiator protein
VTAVPRKTLEAHWARITEQLIDEFGQNVFDCWFRRVQLEGQRGNAIVLTVPTKFLRSWIRSHYLKRIKALWHEALSAIEDVALDLRGVERVPPNAAAAPARAGGRQAFGLRCPPRLGTRCGRACGQFAAARI